MDVSTETRPDAATVTKGLLELDDLITSALEQLAAAPATPPHDREITLRLRLARACYDTGERMTLLTSARQLRLPRPHAALVLAAQARRDALDGSADEAIEHWRQAIAHAIHDGRTDDAGGWLYAIRAVNARYGPWTNRIDDEHLLAQALPKTTSGRLIRRVRNPETDAHRAALDSKPSDAIRAARRWLADSITVGDWVDEHAAAELLGDLYASNAEPERAAACYQWAGETTKLVGLTETIGDRLLPPSPLGVGPWWRQETSLAGVAAQHDLLGDDTAAGLLHSLLELIARGRAGELIEGPTQNLTLQATYTACALAGRSSSTDAQALLDLFAGDVARGENEYRHHDEQHVQACLAIIAHHEQLTWPALVRIFDLAEVGTHHALDALTDNRVLNLLRPPAPGAESWTTNASSSLPRETLTGHERLRLQERLCAMAAAGSYRAGLAVCMIGETDHGVLERAAQARDRLLNRPEPDGRTVSFGTQMVADSYLVRFLGEVDKQACLDKMLTIAADRREAAQNRWEALAAAGNLVLDRENEVKAAVHARSRAFVDGEEDGSFLDDEVTEPHPLSDMKIRFGSRSLRAAGLRLALCSSTNADEQKWVRDRAALMLRTNDENLISECALTLSRLDADIIGDLDATLLVGHPMPVVRQLATVIAVTDPARYELVLHALAIDPHKTVRTLLAQRLHTARMITGTSEPIGTDNGDRRAVDVVGDVLGTLSKDIRHTVRRATAGLSS